MSTVVRIKFLHKRHYANIHCKFTLIFNVQPNSNRISIYNKRKTLKLLCIITYQTNTANCLKKLFSFRHIFSENGTDA